MSTVRNEISLTNPAQATATIYAHNQHIIHAKRNDSSMI